MTTGSERGDGIDLRIDGVGKRYGNGVQALDDFSLEAGAGVLGLLGPNGAGKSTLMRILATVTRPTTGRVYWNGDDIVRRPDPLRRVLGYLPQDFGIYPNLTAREFLEYLAAVKGIPGDASRPRIDRLLELVNLVEVADHRLEGFSGGMRQRVAIAQALLNDPELLIVDEPTAGLDPEERVRFRNLLSDLSGDRLVLLSTHIVTDVEAVATRIAVIRDGRLVAHALPEELLRRVDGRVWTWTVSSSDLVDVRRRWRISAAIRRSDGVQVRTVADEAPSSDARRVSPSLEDAYLDLVSPDPDGEG